MAQAASEWACERAAIRVADDAVKGASVAAPPAVTMVIDPPSLVRDATVAESIDARVDYDAFTRRAFGSPCPLRDRPCRDRWTSLTVAQRIEVRDLFANLLRAKSVEDAEKWTFACDDEAHACKANDLLIGGISLTRIYYRQIDAMFDDPARGYREVVTRLRAKTWQTASRL